MHKKEKPFQQEINNFFHTRGLSPSLIEGKQEGWRMRARLAVRGSLQKVAIGLFEPGTHDVIDRASYPEHHPAIDRALAELRQLIDEKGIRPYDEQTQQGDLRYVQFTAGHSGEIQTALVANGEQAAKKLTSIDMGHSVWINVQEGSINAIFGKKWIHVKGEKWLWQTLSGMGVTIHPGCFIQSNLSLFERILEAIKVRILTQTSVLELYAGVGVLGLSLAAQASHVTMAEINPLAHLSFNESIKKAHYPEKCIHHILSAAEAASLIDQHQILIVDPPRKGCDPEVLEAAGISNNLEQILYLSCSFTSLKKDVEALEKSGWKVVWAEIYDLFPGTEHFEYLIDLRK